MKPPLSRRQFIRAAGLTGLVLPASGLIKASGFSLLKQPPEERREVHIFSKHLQWLNYKHMAEFAAECDFDGIDITVRPGGHVEPERAGTDLPEAVSTVRRTGKKVRMITTEIKRADEPHTRSILQTAGQLGIEYYRMGWYDYAPEATIGDNLEEIKRQLRDLAILSRQCNIKAAYQNHAGLGVGAPVWDIAQVLHGLDSPWIGCQYDIRHATVEGGNSWPLAFDYVKPYINSLDIKDFLWSEAAGKWIATNVPLGQGMVDFDKYFSMIRSLPATVPMCLHVEYSLGGAEHGGKSITMSAAEVMKVMKADLDYIRRKTA